MRSAAFEEELPRSHDAPWVARRLLAERLGGELEPDRLHTAKLLTSELVTNAIVHGQGRILLRASLETRRMLIEVADEGEGFKPRPAAGRFEDPSGRGLAIVASEAKQWGVHGDGTQVWFTLDR